MQAITTKVFHANNVRGTRIKAECEHGSLIIPYPNGDMEQAHRYAAKCLMAKFCKEDASVKEERYRTPIEGNPWNRPFVTGQTKQGPYVHTFIDGMKDVANTCGMAIATLERVYKPKGPISSISATLDALRAIVSTAQTRPLDAQGNIL